MTNEWTQPDHVLAYLERMKDIPHRAEGEATLLAEVPTTAARILDLGCGDGHLLALLLAHCPQATGVGLDLSSTMLDQANERFADNDRVSLVQHDMDDRLPDLGGFDCVVSSFAIHHCADKRKRQLYGEVWPLLAPGGIFCNLEHVSSPNANIHDQFVAEMGMTHADEDPSNKLLDVETQLRWLRQIGFQDVDCYWKWRELALLIGRRPKMMPSEPEGDDEPVLVDSPSIDEIEFVDGQLEEFNRRQTGRDDFEPLRLIMRDTTGSVIAGLKGLTVWDWLYIQVLWVHDDKRRKGIGSKLLRRAEQFARQRKCSGSCLSTFSFQGPDFYQNHGYAVVGQIDDYPNGQTLFFMNKSFWP